MQRRDDGIFYPLRFASRGLTDPEKAQENREREMRAGVFGMNSGISLIAHNTFTWFTDHANIRWAMTAKAHHQRIARLALWLSQYHYNLQHLAGKHVLLQIVDSISRLPIPNSTDDDDDVYCPFEDPQTQSILNSAITDNVIRCSSQFELSMDTQARLSRNGVDIVPNRQPIGLALDHQTLNNERWSLPISTPKDQQSRPGDIITHTFM